MHCATTKFLSGSLAASLLVFYLYLYVILSRIYENYGVESVIHLKSR